MSSSLLFIFHSLNLCCNSHFFLPTSYLSNFGVLFKPTLCSLLATETLGNFLQYFSRQQWADLRTVHWACVAELGYAEIYVQHLHPDWDKRQIVRIRRLAFEVAKNWHNTDLHYWRHMFAVIIDEIENMC